MMKYAGIFKEVMDIRRGMHPDYSRRGDAVENVESYWASLARKDKELALDIMKDLQENSEEYIVTFNAAPISIARAVKILRERTA